MLAAPCAGRVRLIASIFFFFDVTASFRILIYRSGIATTAARFPARWVRLARRRQPRAEFRRRRLTPTGSIRPARRRGRGGLMVAKESAAARISAFTVASTTTTLLRWHVCRCSGARATRISCASPPSRRQQVILTMASAPGRGANGRTPCQRAVCTSRLSGAILVAGK